MAAAKTAELLPVYMFIGEDKLKRDTLLDRMQKRVGDMGDLSLNQTNFDGPEVESGDLIVSSCNTVPFLSDKRLVVVKDIEHAKKQVLDVIADYIANPMESTVLVMTGEKLAKNIRIYKAMTKHYPKGFISCDVKKSRGDVVDFVIRLASSRGISMNPEAASHLVDLVGTSTVELDSEMVKLADYMESQGEKSLGIDDIDKLVVKTTEPKPWEIADVLCTRDVGRCLEMLGSVTEQTPHATLAILVKRVRELLTVKAIDRRPVSTPIETVLGGQSWMYRRHREYAARFKQHELIQILGKAADCELKMKTGSDPELCLEMWIIGVCTGVWSI